MHWRVIIFILITSFGYGQVTNLEELENVQISALAKDDLGRLWIASSNGLYCYDGSIVLKFNSKSKLGKLQSDDINGMVYNGKLKKLITTSKNGLNVFNPYECKNITIKIDTIQQRSYKNHVWNPCLDSAGNTWFANQEGYLCRLDVLLKIKKHDVTVPVPMSLRVKYGNSFFINSLSISNNRVYYGTSQSLVCSFNINTSVIKVISSGNRAFTGAIETDQSTLIFDFKGIHQRDKTDTIDKKFYAASIINSVYRDDEGVVWFVLNKSKVFKLNKDLKPELVYEFDANTANKHKLITSLLVDKNRIWIGTTRGLLQINRPNKAFVRIFESMEGYSPVELSTRGIVGKSDSIIICAGYNYLAQYNFKRNTSQPLISKTMAKDIVSYGLYLNNDSLWIASEGAGLKLFDLKTNKFKEVFYRNKILKEHFANSGLIKCITKIDSNLYLGEYGLLGTYNFRTNFIDYCDLPTWPYPWFKDKCRGINQIMEINKSEILFVSSGKLYLTDKNLRVKSKLVLHDPNNPDVELGIFNVMIDRNGFWWLGTDKGGICKYDWKTGEKYWYNTENGLCDNAVYYSLQSLDNRVWVATNFGLSVIDIKNNRINNFFEEDGIANNEFNTNSYYRAGNGDLYFGGMKGVTRIIPSLLLEEASTDHLIISSINMAGIKSTDSLYLSGLDKIKHVVLPYQSRFIKIIVSLLNYSNKNRYDFRLLGADSSWISLDKTNTVMFNSLEPGNYTLQIRAWNERGELTPEIITLSIEAEQVFYRKLWFIVSSAIIITILIGLIFYIVYRTKIKGLHEMADMRLKIATDLHDQVGGLLNKTATQAEVAQMKLKQQDVSLTKIADNSRVALNSMRDILWNLDPRNDDPESIVVRMSEYAQKMLDDSNSYELNLSILKEIKLSHELRQVVNTVFKESINNIVKHAPNERVLVKAEKINNLLLLSVYNSGKFAPKNELSGQGIRNMKMRMAKVGGEFILDHKDGVLVKFVIPIKFV